jgi:hypothetical protein
MADDPAGLVSAYYQILQAGAGSYDPERLRLILVPDLDFDGPIAGHIRGADRFTRGVAGFIETHQGHPLPAAGDHARRGRRALQRGPAGRHAGIRRLIDGCCRGLGQVDAEVLGPALPPGPGALLLGPGQVQRQRVAPAGCTDEDQRPGPEHLGHAEGPRVERGGAVVLGHQQVDVTGSRACVPQCATLRSPRERAARPGYR